MRRRFNAIVILVALACATAPRIAPNRYGLEVVPDLATYQRLARLDPDKELVDLARRGRARTTTSCRRKSSPIARCFAR